MQLSYSSMPRLAFCLALLLLCSCRDSRIKDHPEWGDHFKAHHIASGCFMLRDHTHETIHYFNKDRCLQRFTPTSTFKIFNSLVALELGVAQDDNFVIPYNGAKSGRDACDTSLTLREAFRRSCNPYFIELDRRLGRQNLQHFMDTVKYGNMVIGKSTDSFWVNNALQISADEQVGFLKRLYFEELPFSERSQSIIRSMMLWEDTSNARLYYKTGWGNRTKDTDVLWIVGFLERTEQVKEHKESMNKTGVRNYPYIFALNFDAPHGDTSQDWAALRIKLLHELLDAYLKTATN